MTRIRRFPPAVRAARLGCAVLWSAAAGAGESLPPWTLPGTSPETIPDRPPAPGDFGNTATDVVVQGVAQAASAAQAGTEDINLPPPPAWAARPIDAPSASQLLPFGANLFQGRFSRTRPDSLASNYVIVPGDRITLRIWGNENRDGTLDVDHQGNVFIPGVGPVRVGGLQHSALQSHVAKAITSRYPSGVQAYTTLLSPQPMTVYVTGYVNQPGQYAGGTADSLLAFIDRAGGIVNERGSYRSISVKRGQREVANVDLYSFIRAGNLPDVRLEEGDVVLVEERGPSIAALGQLRQKARYEFPAGLRRVPGAPAYAGQVSGAEFMQVASPLGDVTHAGVSGTRDGKPFSAYLSLANFGAFALRDGDVVEFVADGSGDGIMVRVTGAITGEARFPLKKGTTLCQLMSHVSVDQNIADLNSVYLRRRSVAAQQGRAIEDSLQRLEKMAFTAPSSSPAEAEIRAREAEMIKNFVERARHVRPDGVVVVMNGGRMANPMLEDGDVVVIPQKNHVVQVSGEVLLGKVLAYRNGFEVKDYLDASGGFTRRADRRNVLVVHPNGEVVAARTANILPGDHILVLPRHESKNLLLVKDLSQILYQIAIVTKVALDL